MPIVGAIKIVTLTNVSTNSKITTDVGEIQTAKVGKNAKKEDAFLLTLTTLLLIFVDLPVDKDISVKKDYVYLRLLSLHFNVLIIYNVTFLNKCVFKDGVKVILIKFQIVNQILIVIHGKYVTVKNVLLGKDHVVKDVKMELFVDLENV